MTIIERMELKEDLYILLSKILNFGSNPRISQKYNMFLRFGIFIINSLNYTDKIYFNFLYKNIK